MLDRSTFWTASGAFPALQGEGLSVSLVPSLPQVMVSGDFAGFCRREALPEPVGLLGETTGARYSLRLARNRMLAVGVDCDHAGAGWQENAAITPMTGALAVLEIAGPRQMELFSRGSAIDPRSRSASAALQFAGVTVSLYRHEATLRLHIDRGLIAYLQSWLVETELFTGSRR